ncbi:MAG TPA: NAD(P) transhydrogenase subunit alpha, partial [Planctomycetes bacterium]|nr:NAD(P) transhydrogenase subunit alpha [Planctomycetota bacterium]
VMEAGAGAAAGFSDEEFSQRGATVAGRDEALDQEVQLQVRLGRPEDWRPGGYRRGQVVVGLADPLGQPALMARWAEAGVSLFALELLPRITRAQGMDVLSSQATVAGYRAVILAAHVLPKMFPMLMTAAGTIQPARVLVVGAGVAGLQAIATARRLGAVVTAYDVRPAAREQVESLGARFLALELETADAEAEGGYARAMDEQRLEKQRELMTRAVAQSDVVITTAAVPGRPAPVLITSHMVQQMRPGSVIVDVAAERGGNCQLTEPGRSVEHGGVTILGPLSLPSDVPYHASQMYGKNMANFLLHVARDGQPDFRSDDEILRSTLVTRDGQVVHPRVRELLQQPADTEQSDSGPSADSPSVEK